MARTAPIPNIPAIPGMNPGVFIMGGGGAGGGGNGQGGSGSGAGQGGSGQSGGNGANGGGRGASSCGPGSGGGCMNPAHGGGGGTHAGDPVDPVTGRVYTLPQTDLVLTGPLVFELRRSYSSFARERDVGLGAGWTHSLAWEIELRRRTMVVHAPSGTACIRDIPPLGGDVTLDSGARLRRDEEGFLVTGEDGLVYLFEPGATSRDRHRLAAIVDRAGNRIDLVYRGDMLEGLRDSVGRAVHVRRYPSGRIEAFELVTARGRVERCRTYAYDEQGDLVAASDAVGRSIRYAYEDHRLVEQASPSGLRVFYRYDQQGRCVETWCATPNPRDPALAEGCPSVLADGVTPARGVLHCRIEYAERFTTVYDSRQARRFDRNDFGKIDLAAGVWVEGAAYDARGDLVVYTDPTGARTSYERDAAGRIVAIVDPTGARIEHRHDPQGNVVEARDALGVACQYRHDSAGNLLEARDALGELLRFTYDERGLRVSAALPDGSVTLFRHDAEGNLVELVEPHGKPRRMEHDDVGRVLAVTDEEGYRTSFHYDERGALVALRFPNGADVAIERDGDGRITRYRGPGRGAYELAWGGYNLVHELRKPNGEIARFRYDRECQLVEVENERGEVHRIERDAAGRVVAERFFDGRERRYRLDPAGRVQRIQSAAGEATDFERDPCGRVVRRSYTDDTFDAFEYDPVGRLVRAETEATRCEFTYDDRGNLVREAQTCAGRTVVIESAYDAAGRRTALRTSTGYEARHERDVMGRARRIIAGGAAVERTFDAFGRELLRELPGGGRVLCRYDGIGALVERRVLGPVAARGPEPGWVGPLPPGTTYAEGFAHSPGGDLVEHVAPGGERTRFEHDATGRILARVSTHAPAERFAHGGGGRLMEVGPDAPARSYGRGGVLLSRGSVSYDHDMEARRTARIDAATGARHRYEWNGRGLLAAVVLPDGTRVEHTYDTSARRLLKRVRGADGALIETRFVWSGDELLQEITEEIVAGQRRAARARDYLWGEPGEGPLAQRDRAPAGGAEDGWVHHALGAGGAPSLLLSDTGEVLARLRPSVWGALDLPPGAPSPTPWRYPGQYHDDETGLAYNRHRFYDAAVGLYLNSDPVGLVGGLSGFEYARGQPFRVADPDGLTPVQCTVSGHGVRGRGMSASGRNSDPELHPVVAAALPPPVDLRGEPFYPAGRRSPDACAEPGALSEYIRNWEQQNNNGRPLDPNNPRDRRRIQRCLGDITSIQAQHPEGGARAPCENCSQLLGNLRDRWGAPRERVVQPGATSENGTDSQRSTPPDPRWAQGMRQQRRRERRR